MVSDLGRPPDQGNPGYPKSFTVTAKPEGKIGHYVATLTFPQPGDWEWSIEAFPFPQPMPILTVLATAPAAAEPITQSPKWPLLVGVTGLIGGRNLHFCGGASGPGG
jgi:hypothetical protein